MDFSAEDRIGLLVGDLVQFRLYKCRLSGKKVLFLGNKKGLLWSKVAGCYEEVTIHDRMLKSIHEQRP